MKAVKKKIMLKLFLLLSPLFFMLGMLLLAIILISGGEITGNNNFSDSGDSQPFNGVYTEDLPIFSEIKGTGNIPDEIAQLAVGSAVKYRLLPSVILSQWAYESEWGRSQSAKNDTNFFGITWFDGCPYPKGSSRGIGGSEGGNYMKFPNAKASFSYYGYMVASQSNFNASVGNKSPGEVLLILGRGGYAAAGITESSPYFTGAMGIIQSNNLTQYDEFAMSKWLTLPTIGNSNLPGKGNISVLDNVLGKPVNIGPHGAQCYGLTAYYVEKMGGPQLIGSGKEYAERIGEDYDWKSYGWEVIKNPKPSDIKAGDVINWSYPGNLAISIYGHTGVVKSVSGNQFETYEQNSERGQIVAQYSRTFEMNPISSLVRKIK
ncbi:MAG: glucosaminidase domain-containing protein [Enterococcus faecalis]|uniref:glucosaminidase domain-containing protein n=2 Tax=Enterococcus faecalis TaxID=1351 RepID=UPI0006657447|nr:glucosaminidase domain-containing protein [Enterococcus faecalis]MDU6310833.1 glucosaminidase domain-containing protein [Enterococcus faecalis]